MCFFNIRLTRSLSIEKLSVETWPGRYYKFLLLLRPSLITIFLSTLPYGRIRFFFVYVVLDDKFSIIHILTYFVWFKNIFFKKPLFLTNVIITST